MLDIILPKSENLLLTEAAVLQKQALNSGLANGQILNAVVKNIVDNFVQLEVYGRILTARSEVPLSPRQQVQLEVINAQSNKIILRLSEFPLSTVPRQQIDLPASIRALLGSWNLEADDTNLEIAKTLLSLQKPLTAQDILAVRGLWCRITDSKLADLDTITFLYANRIPVQKESITIADHLLMYKDALAHRLNETKSVLDQMLTQLQSSLTKQSILNPQFRALETQIARIVDWSIPIELSPPQISQSLQRFLIDFGRPLEAELATHISTLDASEESLELRLHSNDLSGAVSSTDTFLPVAEVTSSREKKALATQVNALSALMKVSGGIPDRLITVISDLLSNLDLDDQIAQLVRNFEDPLQNLALDTSANHLSNLVTTSEVNSSPFYCFPLPLLLPEGAGTGYLTIHKNIGEEKINPDNMRLALLLDLPELGEITVKLQIVKKHITGQITSSREKTYELIETQISDLHDALKKQGYQTSKFVIDVAAKNHQPSPQERSQKEDNSNLLLSKINLKV
jgi:flagellar hook-length control protein FliK